MALSKPLPFPQEKFFPIAAHVNQFFLHKPDTRGYNRMYKSSQSRYFLFNIDNIDTGKIFTDHPIHKVHTKLELITNDFWIPDCPTFFRSTCAFPNTKFKISTLLMYFFERQRVIPRRIQNKYFTFLRDKLVDHYNLIHNRLCDTSHNNRRTHTYFKFSYKKYHFYLGIFVSCNPKSNRLILSCENPSSIVFSNNR